MGVWRIMCQVKKLDTSANFCDVCPSVCGARVMRDVKKGVCVQLGARLHDCVCLAPSVLVHCACSSTSPKASANLTS